MSPYPSLKLGERGGKGKRNGLHGESCRKSVNGIKIQRRGKGKESRNKEEVRLRIILRTQLKGKRVMEASKLAEIGRSNQEGMEERARRYKAVAEKSRLLKVLKWGRKGEGPWGGELVRRPARRIKGRNNRKTRKLKKGREHNRREQSTPLMAALDGKIGDKKVRTKKRAT